MSNTRKAKMNAYQLGQLGLARARSAAIADLVVPPDEPDDEAEASE
jgi:hypothetical protein